MACGDTLNTSVILDKVRLLEDSLKCKVCKHLLNDPLLILKCGHSCCKPCFGRHHDLTCPVCVMPLSTRDTLEDKQLKELLSQLLQLKRVLREGDAAPSSSESVGAPVMCSTPKVGRKRLSTKTPPVTPLNTHNSIIQQTPVARMSMKPTIYSGRKKSSPNTSSGQSPAVNHLNKKNHLGETLLHRMVIKGDINRVQELLKEGAAVNTQDNNGWTPLHEASNHGYMEIVKVLLDNGALVNVPSLKDSVTPLHDALLNEYQMDMALLLVSRGADLHAKTSFGYTALDICKTDKDRNALIEACSPFIEGSTIMANTSKVTPAKCDKMIILSSNLTDTQKLKLQKCATMLKAEVVDEFKIEVTHIVTSCDSMGNCTRTMKILLGMLTGKWVMNYEWVESCLDYKQRVDEEVFEVQGTKNQPNTQGPKLGRTNYEQKFPPLFSGLNFYLHGAFRPPTPNREELCNLITLGGGRILSREPRPTDEEHPIAYHATATSLEHTPNIILYQDRPPRDTHVTEGGVCTSQVMWLIQCISQFKLLPPQQTSIPEK